MVGDLCHDVKVEESTWTLGQRTRPHSVVSVSNLVSRGSVIC